MSKDVEFLLLPKQAEFLFGIPEDKFHIINEETGLIEISTDISCYQGGYTCIPGETEYLSPVGWKKIETLTKEDKLAVYNEDGHITFEHPKEIFKYPADKWYSFNTRHNRQCLCPNHKIVYFKEDDKEMLHPKFIKCEDFVNEGCNSHYKIRNTFKPSNETGLTLSEAEIRLLVAYQADGYDYQKANNCKTSKRTLGFHLKKTNKIERLQKILEATGFKYYTKLRSAGIKKGYRDIFVEAPKELAKYKHFPKEWYSLGDRELSIIFDEVRYWDCSHKNGLSTEGSWTYSSNNKDDRDFIQFVCASQGKCTTTYERTRNIKLKHNEKEYEYKDHKEYTVSWTKAKPISMGKATIQEVKGGEAKYCPSTSTKMWLARYKNYIFVTGNS